MVSSNADWYRTRDEAARVGVRIHAPYGAVIADPIPVGEAK
jgi:hypothetical protein